MPFHLFDVGYFLHAAESGSLLGGSRRAHVTPPAMTKAIQRLEEELGVRLFARGRRGSALTPDGARLAPLLRSLLDDAERVRAAARGKDRALGGEVRIMAMEVFSPFLLPRAISRLVAKHPEIVPLAHEGIPEKMARLVADRRIDVAFTIGRVDSPALHTEILGTSPGVLVCGRRHPLRRKKRITRRDLQVYPSVVPRFWDSEHLPSLDQFPDDDWPRRVGATIELLRMGVALVQENAYLGYFPEICIVTELAAGTLHRLLSPPATPFKLTALLPAAGQRREAVALVEEVKRALNG